MNMTLRSFGVGVPVLNSLNLSLDCFCLWTSDTYTHMVFPGLLLFLVSCLIGLVALRLGSNSVGVRRTDFCQRDGCRDGSVIVCMTDPILPSATGPPELGAMWLLAEKLVCLRVWLHSEFTAVLLLIQFKPKVPVASR